MKIPKEKLKEELHKDFEEFVEEREKFVAGFSPKDAQAWKCEVHNIWINRNSPCPECEYEKRLAKQSQEIMEGGLFGKINANREKQLEKADQIKLSLKRKTEKRKKIDQKQKNKLYKKNEEFRDYQKQKSREATKRSQIRRLEHSI